MFRDVFAGFFCCTSNSLDCTNDEWGSLAEEGGKGGGATNGDNQVKKFNYDVTIKRLKPCWAVCHFSLSLRTVHVPQLKKTQNG